MTVKSKGLPFPDNFMDIFGFHRVEGSERYVEMEQVVEENPTEEKEDTDE